jgi:hypothetical protein
MSLPLKLLTRDELVAVAETYRNDIDELRAENERLRGRVDEARGIIEDLWRRYDGYFDDRVVEAMGKRITAWLSGADDADVFAEVRGLVYELCQIVEEERSETETDLIDKVNAWLAEHPASGKGGE